MILSWVVFPLVLAALGLGWGAIIEWISGDRLGPYTIPVGLAAVILVAAVLTAFSATAPAAAPAAAAGGLVGLAVAWRRTRVPLPALAAGVGVLLVFGAPVILSGQASILGYVRLDDTATWLALIDQFFAHGRSVASLPTSTYQLLMATNVGTSAYPSGAFMILGVGHWITGVDIAWIFQPYLAACAAALAMVLYGLTEPLVRSPWLRALVAFIGAQSALLFGYAAWGGIKELTAAMLLALGLALVWRLLAGADDRARAALPMSVAGAALVVTLGPGAAVYVLPAFAVLAGGLALRARDPKRRLRVLGQGGTAVAATCALALPMWLTLSQYLGEDKTSFASNSDAATLLGNLVRPLRGLQIAGIWLYGDFRDIPGTPPSLLNHVLVWVVILVAAATVIVTLVKGARGLALYALVALAGAVVLWAFGSTPWLIGKSLAISSPAVLVAGAAGAAALLAGRRLLPVLAGIVLFGAIAGGVLWSNFLQYRNVSIAPRDRLAQLQTIGSMLPGHGPTFFNEYEIYGTRHFLRLGAPVSPAEYRPVDLPTLGNALLTKPAWANIDSFGLPTLSPYQSLVIRVGPTESLPPSIYKPVYLGSYYELWQQPAHPTLRVLLHYPLGDSTNDAYCGYAENVNPTFSPLCPIAPAAVPQCSQVMSLGRTAAGDHAELLAYQRANPIVLRATDTQWSSDWISDPAQGSLTPTAAGATAVAHINIPFGVRGWRLWLAGGFARGFTVDVDGHRIGAVSDELNPIGAYDQVGPALTLSPGVHTVRVTYPSETLAPGSADTEEYTGLNAIAIAPPLYPSTAAARMLTVAPAKARSLCGKTLDWIEVVAPQR